MSDYESLRQHITQLEGPEIDAAIELILRKFVHSFNGRSGYDVIPEFGDYPLSYIPFENVSGSWGFFPADNLEDFIAYNFLSKQTQFYVNVETGVDAPGYGLVADKPWKTLHYASGHLPHYCFNTITLNIAPGTYQPYRTYVPTYANNYIVAQFFGFCNGLLTLNFEPTVTINGRIEIGRTKYCNITGTVNITGTGKYYSNVDAGTVGNYVALLQANTGSSVYCQATTKITGVTTTGDGYYRRGVQAATGGVFNAIYNTQNITTTNLYDAYDATQQGRIHVGIGAGTGNTRFFIAEAGGQISYFTQGGSATTAIGASGGGRVYNGAMTSNGRY